MSYKDKDKQREYVRNWVAKRRFEYFKDKCCVNCGSTETLELHHLNPEEKESHSIWSWSEERRLKEIEKCVVLCHDCHWQETIKQFNYNQHGKSRKLYENGCRCILCVEHSKELNKRRVLNRRLKNDTRTN